MKRYLTLAVAALLAPTAAFANGFVVADSNGGIVRSSNVSITVDHLGLGQYLVESPTKVNGCAFIVTAGSGDATIPKVAMATATGGREDPNAARVATYDQDGNPADAGFHLIMQCTSDTAPVWAVVDANGTVQRQLNVVSTLRTGTGAYTVTTFNSAFSTTCAYTAAIGLSGTSGTSDLGIVNVAAVSGATITVRTYDMNGAAADRGFHLFSACNL